MYLQQITHPAPLPHAPPTEMGMGPIRPLSQPPIVNGVDYYNGSGYVAPPPNHPPGPPPNHLGYMGGPPPPPPHMIHAGGGTPPPPVPGPIPNYPPPPPMVGPEKPPYLAEVNSEPVYTNGPPLPLVHEVRISNYFIFLLLQMMIVISGTTAPSFYVTCPTHICTFQYY